MKERASWLNTQKVISKTAMKKMSWEARNFPLQGIGGERQFIMLKAPPNSQNQFYLSQILNREAAWRFNSSLALMLQVLLLNLGLTFKR